MKFDDKTISDFSNKIISDFVKKLDSALTDSEKQEIVTETIAENAKKIEQIEKTLDMIRRVAAKRGIKLDES